MDLCGKFGDEFELMKKTAKNSKVKEKWMKKKRKKQRRNKRRNKSKQATHKRHKLR